MRPVPSLATDLPLEFGLPPRERGGIVEPLDAFGAVGLDDAQLEAVAGRPRLVAQKFAFAFEPPENVYILG